MLNQGFCSLYLGVGFSCFGGFFFPSFFTHLWGRMRRKEFKVLSYGVLSAQSWFYGWNVIPGSSELNQLGYAGAFVLFVG